MKKSSFWVVLSLVLNDVAVLYLLFRLGIVLRNILIGTGHVRWESVQSLGYVGLTLNVILFALFGLYPGYGLSAVKELEKISRATFLLLLFLAAFSYLSKEFYGYPRGVLLLSLTPAMVLLPPLRFLLRNVLSRYEWYGVPVVVYGEEQLVNDVAQRLRRMRRLGWKPAEALPLASIGEEANKGYKVAILAAAALSGEETSHWARWLSAQFSRVVLVQPENKFGTMWIEPRDLDGQLAFEFQYHLLHPFARFVKRMIDILAGLSLLVLLSPLLLLCALLIYLDSPSPVLFRQKRIGLYGRPFQIIKFRTMLPQAEQKLQELLANDPDLRDEFETFHKLKKDPRITQVGAFLRKYSLDELPQLWNVLTGTMSLVGPRTWVESELSDVGDYRDVILRVKPGMTGWWQVTRNENTSFRERLEMDEYYISNWSLWMDMYILMKTAWIVFKGRGV